MGASGCKIIKQIILHGHKLFANSLKSLLLLCKEGCQKGH